MSTGIPRASLHLRGRGARYLIALFSALFLLAAGAAVLWWQGFFPLDRQLPPLLPPPRADDRIVVFAPHPDDETLGAGGYLRRAAATGARVRVAVLTSGEYGRTAMDALPALPAVRALEYAGFGATRQNETLHAAAALGLPAAATTFLCYPDHLLSAMAQPANWLPGHPVYDARLNATRIPYPDALTPGAPYCGEALLRDVERVLLRERPTVMITPHGNDLHPDHWTTSALTQFALHELAARGETFARDCRVYAYLVHRGNWPRPRAYDPALPLLPPPSLAAATRWRRLPLSRRERRLKGAALGLYRSQGGGTHPFMRSFIRANELFALPDDRPWPAAPVVPTTAAILDPEADFAQGARFPAADIRRVTLARRGDEMVLTVTTRAAATPRTRFFAWIAEGGAKTADRRLAVYQWQGAGIGGSALVDGALTALQGTVAGRSAVLRARWPLDGRTRFFLLQAWTSEGGQPADVTAPAVFTLADGTMGNGTDGTFRTYGGARPGHDLPGLPSDTP